MTRDNLMVPDHGILGMAEAEEDQIAREVTLSYRPADERTAKELDAKSYRSYLRRARRGPLSVDEEWSEFVSTGCGTTQDVTLRVTAVEGGSAVGPSTEFRFEPWDT